MTTPSPDPAVNPVHSETLARAPAAAAAPADALSATPTVVVGVGLSSRATRDEVLDLVTTVLAEAGHSFPPAAIATRSCFVADPRLELGVPVLGLTDEELVAHSPPTDRDVGIPARVAQTAAALAAGVPVETVGPIGRSAHVTAAVASGPTTRSSSPPPPPAPDAHHTEVPVPGPHGGDTWQLARAFGVDPSCVIDLSASLNPFAPDTASLVARIARDQPEVVNRYPDPDEASARLADVLGVDPELLVLTNGGSEAISLVASIERVGSVRPPEFSLYERHLERVAPGAPIWRSNPSNPLGQLAGPEDTARVWDEAFYPLATGEWTRGDRDAWRLGSLTKLWGCPGLRLGYLIAPTADAARAVRERQPRWSVNGLAIAALPHLLEATDLSGWATKITDLRDELRGRLVALGFDVTDTDANWLLVRRPGLRAALAPHLVLVRDCSSFGLTDLARVALPRPEQLDQVVAAFERVAV